MYRSGTSRKDRPIEHLVDLGRCELIEVQDRAASLPQNAKRRSTDQMRDRFAVSRDLDVVAGGNPIKDGSQARSQFLNRNRCHTTSLVQH